MASSRQFSRYSKRESNTEHSKIKAEKHSQEVFVIDETKNEYDQKTIMKNLQRFRNDSSGHLNIPDREGSGYEAIRSDKFNPSNDSYFYNVSKMENRSS